MRKIKVSSTIIQEAQNIVDKVYTPLEGFLDKENFLSVLDNMRLTNGLVWSIPIIFDIDQKEAKAIAKEDKISIEDGKIGNII